SVQSALSGAMSDELKNFPSYDWENTEYIASRLIATLAVRRAEKSASGAQNRDGGITTDLASIIGRQRPDGGWPWCTHPECQSDPNVSGWVLLALGEAQRDGISVDSGVVQRASGYVFGWVNRTVDIAHPADVNQKAFLLEALAAAGGRGPVATPARALFEQYRTQLGNAGKAYLLLALTDTGATKDDQQVRTLFDDLAAATIPSANGNHWEDAAPNGWRSSFWTSTTTTALVSLALARVQPEHALIAQTVRWLVVARGAQGWATSPDRAMAILALASCAVQTGEPAGDVSYRVQLDQADVLSGRAQPDRPRHRDGHGLVVAPVCRGRGPVTRGARAGRRAPQERRPRAQGEARVGSPRGPQAAGEWRVLRALVLLVLLAVAAGRHAQRPRRVTGELARQGHLRIRLLRAGDHAGKLLRRAGPRRGDLLPGGLRPQRQQPVHRDALAVDTGPLRKEAAAAAAFRARARSCLYIPPTPPALTAPVPQRRPSTISRGSAEKAPDRRGADDQLPDLRAVPVTTHLPRDLAVLLVRGGARERQGALRALADQRREPGQRGSVEEAHRVAQLLLHRRDRGPQPRPVRVAHRREADELGRHADRVEARAERDRARERDAGGGAAVAEEADVLL